MTTMFTLRERKRAKLRLALLESLLSLLEDMALPEISVEMICERAETNKVTFFQNFKHKEQLLDYFVCRWGYDRSLEIEHGKREGYEGLKSVFSSISRDPLGLKIMVALVGYYARLREVPEMPAISACEYELFNSEAYGKKVRPRTLEQIFIHYLSQIPRIPKKDHKEILQLLVAVLYGVPVQMHLKLKPVSEMPAAYNLALSSALAGYMENPR
jgi:AcrR family transcriptional regulator